MSRTISWSEIDTALTCQARWDFRYGSQLAGSSLKEKAIAPILSGGRAWGAAVAAWHIHAGEVMAGEAAVKAMDESLEKDADEQREYGVHDQQTHNELRTKLLGLILHYTEITEPEVWDAAPERRLLVPIPSRTGVRSSNRYRLICYLDAVETDEDGDLMIHEVKLRGSLLPVSLIVNSRQLRWYAWALQRTLGRRIAGVWVHERLNEVPRPPRLVKTGRKDGSLRPSHAVDQMCTADAYIAACAEYDEGPHETTVDALRTRQWQQRVPIYFRDQELEEAGHELVSAAQQIQMLDTAELFPLRNVKRSTCSWCAYADICPAPDNDLVDVLFQRRPPKRDLETQPVEGAA